MNTDNVLFSDFTKDLLSRFFELDIIDAIRCVCKDTKKNEIEKSILLCVDELTKAPENVQQLIVHELGGILDNLTENVNLVISTLDAVMLHKETNRKINYISLPPLSTENCIEALKYSLKRDLIETEKILAVETGGHILLVYITYMNS